MAKKEGSKKIEPKSAPKGGGIDVGGNVEGNDIIIGHNNVVHKYYQIVEQNTKPNDPDYWNLKHPYPMPPNFTGRLDERAMLTQWLDADSENRLFILRALGGFGKSALAWQWLTHDVDPQKWKQVVFWSFYEGDSSFEHFVEETLKYLNFDIPPNKREQMETLLHALQAGPILLILDGFERALRAYGSLNAAYQGDEETSPTPQPPSSPEGEEGGVAHRAAGVGEVNQLDCVDMNAEFFLKGVCTQPKLKGKVLMTTRLTPRAVKPRGEIMLGCREIKLTAMQPADAVEFFHKQRIQGNRAEIEAACLPYGYHPLSLRLLAGRILKDFENPADILVAQKLKIDGDIIQQKHHVLEVSYNSLPEPEQKLLSTIACFRAPVELGTLETIEVRADGNPPLQDDLHDLVDRGLLHFDVRAKKFDLHPIVRRYAYDRLTAADRADSHKRLVNYFEAVPTPQKVTTLEDLAPVIELYHHMVGAGNLDEAYRLFYERINKSTYYQFGAYQLQIELLRALFLDGEGKPPRLKDESTQAWTLNELANSYSLSGQPRRAVPLFEMQIAIREKEGNKKGVAIGLGNVATQQLVIGALSEAERNLRRKIEMKVNEFDVAVGHQYLGHILSYRGAWQEGVQELDTGLKLFEKQHTVQSEGIIWSYRALRFLLMARDSGSPAGTSQFSVDSNQSAIECAQRALELADEWQKITGRSNPNPRDYTHGLWLLGSAYRANNELTLGEENLSKALNLCRQINNVESEADILLDVARLRYAQQNYEEAKSLGEEALTITERSGYVLQGADVHLFLATLALEGYTLERFRFDDKRELSDKEVARKHAEEALRLAHCDDGPPYYYKVAYEEAERLLETFKIERG